MSLTCKSCNHVNLDEALYCANCSNKLIEKTNMKEETVEEFFELPSESQTLVFIAIFFFILFLILFFIFVLTKENNNKSISYSQDYSSKIEPVKVFYNKKIEKYSLEVIATPPDSKIEILNIDKPYQKDMKLKKGSYTILVSHNGYQSFRKTINLEYNGYVTAILEKNKILKDVSTSNIKREKINKNRVWECNIRWIIDEGEKYKPTNENLQTLSIELIDGADKLYLKTQNGESTYIYSSFIDVDPDDLGMEYSYGNRFIAIFQNKTLFLGDSEHGIDTKYYCSDMLLDISEMDLSNSEIINKVVQSKYSLTIQRIPSSARVRILNIKPKYYDGIKLKKGKYHIEVSQRGYKTFDRWISLKEERSLNIELKKFQIYRSSQTIQYTEPITTQYVQKRMSKKERENLETCMKGYLINTCKHSWLTPQQAQEVKGAERREGN